MHESRIMWIDSRGAVRPRPGRTKFKRGASVSCPPRLLPTTSAPSAIAQDAPRKGGSAHAGHSGAQGKCGRRREEPGGPASYSVIAPTWSCRRPAWIGTFPVMIEAYRRAERRRRGPDSRVTPCEGQAPGSGILTSHFGRTSSGCGRGADDDRLLRQHRDQPVLDAIGLGPPRRRWRRLSCHQDPLLSSGATPDLPERSKEFGLGSTTANDMIALRGASRARRDRQPEGQRGDARASPGLRRSRQLPRFLLDGDEDRLQDG